MKNARLAWALVVLLTASVLIQNKTALERAFTGKESMKQAGEYFAWEKTADSRYKQVKKNYFMDEQICSNVIRVLNEMSTTQAPSNWVLSHTTNSTFECWPASVNPSDFYGKYSGDSDQPNGAANRRK